MQKNHRNGDIKYRRYHPFLNLYWMELVNSIITIQSTIGYERASSHQVFW
jgi:hypothetical protein